MPLTPDTRDRDAVNQLLAELGLSPTGVGGNTRWSDGENVIVEWTSKAFGTELFIEARADDMTAWETRLVGPVPITAVRALVEAALTA